MAVSLGLALLIAGARLIVLKLTSSNDDDAMKGTTSQAGTSAEYVNVTSTVANQQQELYCNINFYSNQVNDVTVHNLADEHQPSQYEALTSVDRQQTQEGAQEDAYTTVEQTRLTNVL